jgi:prophage regulatory protein
MDEHGNARYLILRRPQLEERCGLKRTTIYDRNNPKSPSYDPTFPKPVDLGGGAVGWIESEVEAWLAARVEQRNKSLALRKSGSSEATTSSSARRRQPSSGTRGAA